MLRGIDKVDADGKALRDDHPVERAPDIRDGTRNVDAVGVEHAGTEALHDAFDRRTAVNHRIDGGAVTDGYGVQIGLAEIPDREPFFVVDQREKALARSD